MARKSIMLYNDEYVPSLTRDDQTFYSQPIRSALLQAVDYVVIVTDHSYYDIPWIVHDARSIVNTHDATDG